MKTQKICSGLSWFSFGRHTVFTRIMKCWTRTWKVTSFSLISFLDYWDYLICENILRNIIIVWSYLRAGRWSCSADPPLLHKMLDNLMLTENKRQWQPVRNVKIRTHQVQLSEVFVSLLAVFGQFWRFSFVADGSLVCPLPDLVLILDESHPDIKVFLISLRFSWSLFSSKTKQAFCSTPKSHKSTILLGFGFGFGFEGEDFLNRSGCGFEGEEFLNIPWAPTEMRNLSIQNTDILNLYSLNQLVE